MRELYLYCHDYLFHIGYLSAQEAITLDRRNYIALSPQAFKNGYTFSESLELIAHESFHAVQEAEGQGEKSIFNEVEAHVFGFIIQRNWLASTNTDSVQGVSQANAGRPNDAGRRYEEAFNSLTQSFSPMDMSSAVHNFKTGSSSNASGLYNNNPLKRASQTRYLLKLYYPAK